MRYAILFPGQGGQHAGMLPWLDSEPASAQIVAAMARQLGDDWRVRLQEEDWRHLNAVAQPLVTGTSLAAWAALEQLLPGPPTIVAGYSVGELAAAACANAFDAGRALTLAAERAAAMDRAVAGRLTGLLSVSGLPQEALAEACRSGGLELAIRIAPDHGILAGDDAALIATEHRLAARGVSCKRLTVPIASHSSWMTPAAVEFSAALASVPFGKLRCAVALNASGGAVTRGEALRAALSRQMDATVLWSSCMDVVAEHAPACVVEVGGGRALSRMWSSRHPGIPIRAIEDFKRPRGMATWIERACRR
jgi:[acyl-carrier-protein] S-malonyltransferase